jgi:hypothetical protein
VLVSIQNPVPASEYDEPESDVALLKPGTDDYGTASHRPGYPPARRGFGQNAAHRSWSQGSHLCECRCARVLGDLNAETVYVHRTRVDGAYRLRTIVLRGAQLGSQLDPTVHFTVDEVLG